MTSAATPLKRILAVSPMSKGFGFVVLETPGGLLDWGVKEVKAQRAEVCLRRALRLLDRYRPTILAVENLARDPRRAAWSKQFIAALAEEARARAMKLRVVQPADLRRTLDLPLRGPVSKHAIGLRAVERFPELQPLLPPKRRAWVSEDSRFSLFVAAGVGVS